jgi:hypothetical protein
MDLIQIPKRALSATEMCFARATLVGIPIWWNPQPSFAITAGGSQSCLLALEDAYSP